MDSRLNAPPARGIDGLGVVAEICNQRLSARETAPLMIGLSGGGDSLALLHLVRLWVQNSGRRLIAATVDHQLRSEGADWTRWCRARCADLGVDHVSLTWSGEKPARGRHAAARTARHRLLADAAREAGAKVILLAHTADDVLEAAWMRQAGARTPAPRTWAPSPVWPEGRDTFLLRPLLAVRRATLRAYLRGLGEAWIEDPGNSDLDSLRVQARTVISREATLQPPPREPPGPTRAPPLSEGPAGELFGPLAPILEGGPVLTRLWLRAALVCVGGGARVPAARAVEAIATDLEAGRPVAATLAGARVISDGAHVVLARETRDRRNDRGRFEALATGVPTVWDGRFEVAVRTPGWSVGPLAGRMAKADRAARARLKRMHPAARGAVPAVLDPAGGLRLPTLQKTNEVETRTLVMARLVARCGGIQHESDLAPWRNGYTHPKSTLVSGKRPVDEPS
jgi:tRNA(Ile)-lysidine synthase